MSGLCPWEFNNQHRASWLVVLDTEFSIVAFHKGLDDPESATRLFAFGSRECPVLLLVGDTWSVVADG